MLRPTFRMTCDEILAALAPLQAPAERIRFFSSAHVLSTPRSMASKPSCCPQREAAPALNAARHNLESVALSSEAEVV
jgi:hypothetical protein